MKYVRNIVISLALMLGVAAVAAPVASAVAVDVFQPCVAGSDSAVCAGQGNQQVQGIVQVVVNTLLYVLGIASVLVIIIAGIIYATSGGDSNSIARAKNMLLYAVIGLVVAISAYAIVNFVLTRF